jgi:hypothetical protein
MTCSADGKLSLASNPHNSPQPKWRKEAFLPDVSNYQRDLRPEEKRLTIPLGIYTGRYCELHPSAGT